jgi:hypothetical protein
MMELREWVGKLVAVLVEELPETPPYVFAEVYALFNGSGYGVMTCALSCNGEEFVCKPMLYARLVHMNVVNKRAMALPYPEIHKTCTTYLFYPGDPDGAV